MPKSLIVVLVLVALVFVLAVAVGATREPASPNPDEHAWVELFELGGAPAVELRDVQAACLDRRARRVSIPLGDSCSADIGSASDETRLLTLEPLTGAPPGVRLRLEPRAQRRARELDADAADDFPVELPVGSRGANVRIACTDLPEGASACLLRLAR